MLMELGAVGDIRDHFRRDISREGLAAELDVNPDNLGRLFLMYTGEKIGDYINRLRVEAALRYFEDPGTLIQNVALEVGFENVSTFNRVFKKIMQCTPTDYRARLRE